jgi:hypothetical protein
MYLHIIKDVSDDSKSQESNFCLDMHIWEKTLKGNPYANMARWPSYQFMRHQTAGSILAGMFTNCTMVCDSYHKIHIIHRNKRKDTKGIVHEDRSLNQEPILRLQNFQLPITPAL